MIPRRSFLNFARALILLSGICTQASAQASSANSGNSSTAATGSFPTDPGTTSGVNITEPDFYLNIPTFKVGSLSFQVQNLSGALNLGATIGSLVSVNAGVSVSLQGLNFTLTDAEFQLEIAARLTNLVDIIHRVFTSIDSNPVLLNGAEQVSQVLTTAREDADNLLGTMTKGGQTLSLVVDDIGNIVQEVTQAAGSVVRTVVGNYFTNMTFTGVEKTLENNLTQKTYSYSPLNSLVHVIFNTAGQVVRTLVSKDGL